MRQLVGVLDDVHDIDLNIGTSTTTEMTSNDTEKHATNGRSGAVTTRQPRAAHNAQPPFQRTPVTPSRSERRAGVLGSVPNLG